MQAGTVIARMDTQVLRAQLAETARATVRRLRADLEESELKAPRYGHVRYRVA